MIDLSKLSKTQSPVPKRFAAVEPMTPQQARIEAQKLLQGGLSNTVLHVLDLLAVAGVLPTHRIGIPARSIRRYQQKRLLDRLPYTTPEMQDAFEGYGLSIPEGRLAVYTLGPVGVEIAHERHGVYPPTGFMAYPLERIMHDLVVNEIILSISAQAIEAGWRPVWVGKYEATLRSPDMRSPLLEPDALLRLEKDGAERVYLLEYHNEDKATRAGRKVARYGAAYSKTDVWQEQWDVETFPPLLAVFRKPIVGRGYNQAVADSQPRFQVYGRTLSSALEEGFSIWYHFNQGKKAPVFPWHQEQEVEA